MTRVIANRKKVALGMENRKLLTALSRNITEVKYGDCHYCHKHQKCVDINHIDECDCIMEPNYKITEIIKVLNVRTVSWNWSRQNS